MQLGWRPAYRAPQLTCLPACLPACLQLVSTYEKQLAAKQKEVLAYQQRYNIRIKGEGESGGGDGGGGAGGKPGRPGAGGSQGVLVGS